MKRIITLTITIFCFCVSIYPQATDLVVDCQTPGWLSSKINYGDQQTVRNLKVTGYINSTDLRFIGEMISGQNLNEKVDLSDVNIVNNTLEKNCFEISKYSDIYLKCLSLPKTVEELNSILPYNVYSNGTKLALHIDTLYFNCNVNSINSKMFGANQFDEMPHHIIVGENVETIPDNAFFENKGIKSVKLPTTIKYIGNKAFYQTNDAVEKVNINDLKNLKYLGVGAFPMCQPDTIIVPKSLENPFYLFAFSNKDGQHIFIDDNINRVSGYGIGAGGAWKSSYTTAKLVFHINNTTPPTIENYIGKNSDTNLSTSTVYVPKGAKQAYLDSDWKNATIIEETPSATYSLNITVLGNGTVSYNGSSVCNQTSTFTINEGSSATITFSPDSGNKIKNVKINDTDVTSNVSSNQYTISSITGNTNIEVEFEPITYTLSIKASGNGSVLFGDNTIKNQTSTFTVNEGTSASVSFTPDSGQRIASVKVNNTDVTASVSNNKYTISNIKANTTLAVTFEAIPPTTYTLSIQATGNGSATYNSTSVKNETKTFTVNEGTSATVSFSPDSGQRIASVKVNNTDVTASVSNNKYTISNIKVNTTLSVTFEAIPPTTYTLSIQATGSGSATYSGTTIKNETKTFTVNEGTSATVSFTPDSGQRIASVKVNNTDVTANVTNNKYTISNIKANTTLSVTFEAIPPTTYTLSIQATGNGSATYSGTTIRNQTRSFTVNEGTSATVSFTPDSGQRIASVKVNNTDVTASVSNNKYTISNIKANTTLTVTFEANQNTPFEIPSFCTVAAGETCAFFEAPSTWTGTIMCWAWGTQNYTGGNWPGQACKKLGTASNGNSVWKWTYTGTLTTQPTTIIFSNNGSPQTEDLQFKNGGYYTIYGLQGIVTATPATTYSLNITASGSGSATFSGTTIRNQTRSFTVNEGTSATVSFTPDSGQRIASVKVNNTDVTANVTNNKYTISNIKSNTTLSVTFEAIPPTTYTLNITASGNGSATYNGTAVRNNTRSFTVDEGTSATVSFTPDSGNRIASVKVNNQDVTAKVANNRYTITNITSSTTVVVNFEEIPPTPVTTYSLSVSSSGGGYALFNGTTIRNQTRTFTLDEGTSATISFTPNSGNRIASVKVNNQDVTASVANYQYTISSIAADTKLEVTFEEIVNALVNEDVNYSVVSQDDKTVRVSAGKYGLVLTVPESFVKNGVTWTVTGIEANALKDNADLAAIIWNPSAAFTATVSNLNLLLYVKDAQYAPEAVKNVVVNGTANSITLVDAESGNNFYCPQQFIARNISYIHHYGMATGIGESRGWETISLPFDVQTVTHATKGAIVPFKKWTSGDTEHPFWLYELNGTGWTEAQGIKAYTPYIISMPNNSKYKSQFQLAGNVTFAATNVTVGKTDDLHTATYSGRTFTPTFSMRENGEGIYALNVNNDFIVDNSGMTEGSRFVLNMRKVHPFEAFMTSALQARQFFEVFETGTEELDKLNVQQLDYCYDLAGRKIVNSKSQNSKMPKGVYIMNGKKIIIK